jgi:hypothetical protein
VLVCFQVQEEIIKGLRKVVATAPGASGDFIRASRAAYFDPMVQEEHLVAFLNGG